MRKTFVTWLLCVACLLPMAAHADFWLPPSTQQYESADGQWRLTVDPRQLTSQLAYFNDKVDGKPQAGGEPGDAQASAMATLEHKVKGKWQRMWRKPLRNDVSPVEAVVLSGGAFMTLDNWHGMGFGPDDVVLYNRQGEVTGQYALADFLPRRYVQALPRSVSSLQWRGEALAQADGRTIGVQVRIPSEDDDVTYGDDANYFLVVFEPVSGTFARPDGPVWERAKAAAQRTLAARAMAEEADYQRFISPLFGPADNSERNWKEYMIDAYVRVNAGGTDELPSSYILRSPDAAAYKDSEASLHDALKRKPREGAMIIATQSQDALVSRLAIESAGIAAGALSKMQIYLALDDAHFALARASLAKSGAKVFQLNPGVGIPQRPERLAKAREVRDAEQAGGLDDGLSR